jgi:hypothetical protein
MKHTNTICGQNAELFNVKPGGRHTYHCALKNKKNKEKETQILIYSSLPSFLPQCSLNLKYFIHFYQSRLGN